MSCAMLGSKASISSHKQAVPFAVHQIRHQHTMKRLNISCGLQGNEGAPSRVRRLILMRHAESDESKKVRDHDRPITGGGEATAQDVGAQLRRLGWLPDVLVCSNALRSRQTLDEMRKGLPELEDADAHYLGSLYTISQFDGQTRSHLQEVVLSEAADRHSCVLCLGHNKGWEEAASSFANEEVKLGNCHAALLEGAGVTWQDALGVEAQWRLVDVLKPQP